MSRVPGSLPLRGYAVSFREHRLRNAPQGPTVEPCHNRSPCAPDFGYRVAMLRTMALFGSCLFVGLLGKAAEAAAPTAGSPAPHFELTNTRWQALSVESLVAGTGLASAWFFTGGPRKTCRWCDSNAFDEGVRSTLKASEPRAPALVSHGLSVVAVPALTLTGLIVPAYRDERTRHGLEDSWIVLNTFLITTAIGDLTKHLVARERPTFHHRSESETEFSNLPNEHNKSFFSLDTAWAFAIASSGATLAHLRGYSSANYIAVGGGCTRPRRWNATHRRRRSLDDGRNYGRRRGDRYRNCRTDAASRSTPHRIRRVHRPPPHARSDGRD